jgi:hypothetical protein
MQLEGIELGAFSRKLALDIPGERQIPVVAAEQNVLAHSQAVERQLTSALRYRDEGKIRRAPTDIDHQNQVARLNALSPVGVAFNPGVEGSLGLLEHDDIAVNGLIAGSHGEIPRNGIERRRDCNEHLLRLKRCVGVLLVPGGADMFQLAARRLNRRKFLGGICQMQW